MIEIDHGIGIRKEAQTPIPPYHLRIHRHPNHHKNKKVRDWNQNIDLNWKTETALESTG